MSYTLDHADYSQHAANVQHQSSLSTTPEWLMEDTSGYEESAGMDAAQMMEGKGKEVDTSNQPGYAATATGGAAPPLLDVSLPDPYDWKTILEYIIGGLVLFFLVRSFTRA